MKQTILFVTGEYPPMHGGVGDYTERLARALGDEGWQPVVLTSRDAASEASNLYAEVQRWNWHLMRTTRRIAAAVDAAVVHVQFQTGAFGMHPAINLLPWSLRHDPRFATVTTFHDLREPYLFPKAGVLRPLANRVLARSSDAVVVTNAEDQRRMKRIRGLETKLCQIPIGSNLIAQPGINRLQVLAHLGIRPSEPLIGFFGFPTPDKGIELLIEVLAGTGEGAPRLVMVGGDLADTDRSNRDYASKLYQRVARLRPTPVITGHLKEGEAAAVLGSVDLIVLPFRQGASLRNGTLLAALATGRPVITTAPRHPEDLLPFRDQESFLLSPPGDLGKLRQLIDSVLEEPGAHERLGERARANLAPHSWQSIARRHVELYESLLQRRSERPKRAQG